MPFLGAVHQFSYISFRNRKYVRRVVKVMGPPGVEPQVSHTRSVYICNYAAFLTLDLDLHLGVLIVTNIRMKAINMLRRRSPRAESRILKD